MSTGLPNIDRVLDRLASVAMIVAAITLLWVLWDRRSEPAPISPTVERLNDIVDPPLSTTSEVTLALASRSLSFPILSAHFVVSTHATFTLVSRKRTSIAVKCNICSVTTHWTSTPLLSRPLKPWNARPARECTGRCTICCSKQTGPWPNPIC